MKSYKVDAYLQFTVKLFQNWNMKIKECYIKTKNMVNMSNRRQSNLDEKCQLNAPMGP